MLRNRPIAFIALLAGCLAACSGGTTPSPSPTASQAAAATQAAASTKQAAAATTQPTTNPAGAAAGTDICALLPSDQVAQITGLTISGSTPLNDFLTTNDARCQYGENNEVVIDVISPGGQAYYNNLASGYGSNVNPIAGIGDKAFQDFTDGSGLVALFGDAAFDVYIDNPNDAMSDDDINRVSETLITTLKAKL